MLVRQTTADVIRQAARETGVRLLSGGGQSYQRGRGGDGELSPSGKGFRFTIRTQGRPPKYGRRGFIRNKAGDRCRIPGAVCWHGHRDFMRRLFQLAPDAILISAMARYDGAGDFESRHGFTAYKQVGSQMDPVQFSELCDCPEGNGFHN